MIFHTKSTRLPKVLITSLALLMLSPHLCYSQSNKDYPKYEEANRIKNRSSI